MTETEFCILSMGVVLCKPITLWSKMGYFYA